MRWNLNVKGKLSLFFFLILLVPSILIGTFSYLSAKQKVDDQFSLQSTQSIQLLNSTIDQFVQDVEDNADYLADQITSDAVKGGNEQLKHTVLIPFMKKHPELSNVDIGFQDGFYLNAIKDLSEMEAGYDPRARPWYEQAMSNKEKVGITSPYVSKTTGDFVIGIEKAIHDGTGVLHFEVKLNTLANITKNIKIGNEGYVFLLDEQSKYLSHPTAKAGEEAKGSQIETMFKSDSGAFEYILDGKPMKMAFVTNKLTGWKLAGTWYAAESTQAAAPIFNQTLLVLILSVVAGAVIVYFIIRSITIPLHKLMNASQKMSEGNLLERVQVTSRDEFGQLSQYFNAMSDSIRAMITEITHTSSQLATASEELTASAEQTARATDQVAISIQEMASGAEAQVSGSTDTVRAMGEMTVGIQQIAETSSIVSDAAVHTQQESVVGNEIVLKVVQQMDTIQFSVTNSVAMTQKLNERSNEIEQIVSVITDISAQTNLLALNAAIEAARAGEQGRGFAVVADEVRKLAEQSVHSSNQIRNIIQSIQTDTIQSVESMNKVSEEVQTGVNMVYQSGQTFERILHDTRQVAQRAQELSAISRTMFTGSEQVNSSVEQMADIAKTSATEFQSIAATSEEQLASMEEITSSAASLSRMAEDLQHLIEKFEI